MTKVNHASDLRRDRFAGGLLLALGVLTLGTAIYFLVGRPAMLPEDARFKGIAVDAVSPRMSDWLAIVFHTWGGFMAGFGTSRYIPECSFATAARSTTTASRYCR